MDDCKNLNVGWLNILHKQIFEAKGPWSYSTKAPSSDRFWFFAWFTTQALVSSFSLFETLQLVLTLNFFIFFLETAFQNDANTEKNIHYCQ